MGEVEINHSIFSAAEYHFVNDSPRYHIARRELMHIVVTVHEAVQFHVAQVSAFTA